LPRRLGQHFLADGAYAARIVRAAKVTSDDFVVEVGPGRGSLTHLLAQARPKSLTLVELDHTLAEGLRKKYTGNDQVSVIEADARTLDVGRLPGTEVGKYKVVGNLPYYAASPIVRNFLESRCKPSLIVVMVQREVADEMAAGEGKKGMLSLGVQMYADVEKLFEVPPSAFRPPPKVTSAVVRLTVLPQPRVAVDSEAAFFSLVRAGSRAPRKQLRNSLALGLGASLESAGRTLARAGIEASRRPGTLSLEEWGMLYRSWLEQAQAVPEAAP